MCETGGVCAHFNIQLGAESITSQHTRFTVKGMGTDRTLLVRARLTPSVHLHLDV